MKPKQRIIFQTFPQTLRRLREKKGWSQGQLAKKVSIDLQNISKYERALVCPPPDMMLQLADLFEVSLDYLMRGEEKVSLEEVKDQELLRRLRSLNEMPQEDRTMVIAVLDAFIKKYHLEYAAQRKT